MPCVLSVFGIKPRKIGGQEAFARELSVQLGRHGWNSVLCFDGPPLDSLRHYLRLPNVSLERLDNPQRMDWRTVRDLAVLLRRHRADILHLNYTGFLTPYPWVAKLCSVDKVFFTDQTSRPAGYRPRRAPVWKRLFGRLINHPTRVVCVSEYGYHCLTTLDLLPTSRFTIVYNAVDSRPIDQAQGEGDEFRRKYGIPKETPLVLQVSSIVPEKGIPELLAAARLVLNEERSVHFALVGDGDHRQEYARLVNALEVPDHVTWTGLVENPVAAGVYAAADIVCQVSNWEEVFGYVIAEAMAASRPVVATRVGGIPEVVKDGETGFLVERGDVRGIADRILRLLADRNLRERLGRAGQELVSTRFDLSRNVAQLLRLYGITENTAGQLGKYA